MAFEHYSVLLNETVENLNIDPGGVYVDGTLGGAGHSSVIASKLTTGRLIGIDRDEAALAAAVRLPELYNEVFGWIVKHAEKCPKCGLKGKCSVAQYCLWYCAASLCLYP